MFPTLKRKQCNTRTLRNRSGAAVVEAALCIPLIIILMFGTLEISAGYYLKESLTIAAYEGARTGVKRRATKDQVVQRVKDILEARNVSLGQNGRITVTPDDLTTLETLDPLTVTVSAPSADNSAFIFNALANRSIDASVKMAREFDH